MQYIAVIHKEDDSCCYGVSFPDFPGCVTATNDLDEVKSLAREVLTMHINGMLEDGEQLPPPTSQDAIIQNPDFADASELFAITVNSSQGTRYGKQ